MRLPNRGSFSNQLSPAQRDDGADDDHHRSGQTGGAHGTRQIGERGFDRVLFAASRMLDCRRRSVGILAFLDQILGNLVKADMPM